MMVEMVGPLQETMQVEAAVEQVLVVQHLQVIVDLVDPVEQVFKLILIIIIIFGLAEVLELIGQDEHLVMAEQVVEVAQVVVLVELLDQVVDLL